MSVRVARRIDAPMPADLPPPSDPACSHVQQWPMSRLNCSAGVSRARKAGRALRRTGAHPAGLTLLVRQEPSNSLLQASTNALKHRSKESKSKACQAACAARVGPWAALATHCLAEVITFFAVSR